MPLAYTYYKSPIGWIEIAGTDDGIESMQFVEDNKPINVEIANCLKEAYTQLEEYFANDRKSFDLKLNPKGTEFQQKVWAQLLEIEHNKTISYLDLAIAIGDRKASQAVGNANGKNPIAIVIPCHRVIGRNGKLVGYAGGLYRKEWLLDFEKGQGQLFN